MNPQDETRLREALRAALWAAAHDDAERFTNRCIDVSGFHSPDEIPAEQLAGALAQLRGAGCGLRADPAAV